MNIAARDFRSRWRLPKIQLTFINQEAPTFASQQE
jgi:hypothetical protein